MEDSHRQRNEKRRFGLQAGLTTKIIAKLGRNENVNTEALAKICKVLDCNICNIMDFINAINRGDYKRYG